MSLCSRVAGGRPHRRFYILALALIGGLVAALFVPGASGQVFAFSLIGAIVVAISIIPWPRPFIPPGPLLNPAGQPRLFAEFHGVAIAVSEAMPADVYVTPDMNAEYCSVVVGESWPSVCR